MFLGMSSLYVDKNRLLIRVYFGIIIEWKSERAGEFKFLNTDTLTLFYSSTLMSWLRKSRRQCPYRWLLTALVDVSSLKLWFGMAASTLSLRLDFTTLTGRGELFSMFSPLPARRYFLDWF